ncbi:uncharacterized protein LOC110975445 [Acanthaster planci]|uniref:Uncharacterized protein LOC110975445 n=1 Tax=Acanthaster planci TaxID=133434 RepID=A0A8B7XUR4_ACAPL|nr:uncharacterized protein LOC110975445 [Acanthaster planci]
MAAPSGFCQPTTSPPSGAENTLPDGASKLTHGQVVRGWRECFSATENRSYFFNIYSRESRWTLPSTPPVQNEENRNSGPELDVLEAAAAELSGNPSPDYSRPPYIKGKGSTGAKRVSEEVDTNVDIKKRKFAPDPEQQENDNNAVKFHIGETSSRITRGRREKSKTLTGLILTKLITDEMFRLVNRAQEQLGCEGCEEGWPSLFEHACTFYGVCPESRIHEYIGEFLEEAWRSVDTNRVRPIFHATISLLGAAEFTGQEMDMISTLNTFVQDIVNEWKNKPDQIVDFFLDRGFNNTTEIIQYAVDIVED